MCGIVGITGVPQVASILLEGLRRLEYRGYDSAGIAVAKRRPASSATRRRARSRTSRRASTWDDLERLLRHRPHPLGHARRAQPRQRAPAPRRARSRWSTTASSRTIGALKTQLGKKGHDFTSETDTEVLVHLIDDLYHGNLEAGGAAGAEAGRGHLRHRGDRTPTSRDKIVGARARQPAGGGRRRRRQLPGQRRGGDPGPHPPGHLPGRRRDGRPDARGRARPRPSTTRRSPRRSRRSPGTSTRSRRAATPHFMLKEIFEQPDTIRDAFRGRILPETGDVKLGGLELTDWELRNIRRIIILACGTSLARRPGGRVPDRGVRPHPGGGGVRQRVPLPLADHRAGHPLPDDQPERRDHRHARGHARGASAAAPRSSASPTWWARPSRARARAASTSTPARRSASPRPRPSPARSPSWRC